MARIQNEGPTSPNTGPRWGERATAALASAAIALAPAGCAREDQDPRNDGIVAYERSVPDPSDRTDHYAINPNDPMRPNDCGAIVPILKTTLNPSEVEAIRNGVDPFLADDTLDYPGDVPLEELVRRARQVQTYHVVLFPDSGVDSANSDEELARMNEEMWAGIDEVSGAVAHGKPVYSQAVSAANAGVLYPVGSVVVEGHGTPDPCVDPTVVPLDPRFSD